MVAYSNPNPDPNPSQVAITGGGVTTRYIFEALALVGREDLGLQLATKTTFPSFGYMLDQGPGTIWEQWSGLTFALTPTLTLTLTLTVTLGPR